MVSRTRLAPSAGKGQLESTLVPHQSLYLQYRPQRFAEIKGQDHVVRALLTAVRDHKVGHAYLLHGPRGSGKTSTARVLAKALNCEQLTPEGEPCCTCESCLSIQEGRSFDLQELDAASNNKVDDMRTLLERVNLATPGRAKVYLLDEAHMLTPGAENALLKTLEEPPDHVTWVLATTEPHKVAQTIRSRCQVFELGLVAADLMIDHIRHVIADAALDVDDAVVDHVITVGGGSVRDTLSELDRVATGGVAVSSDTTTDTILEAIAERDPAGALSAIGEATGRGRDPRTIGEMVLAGLRDAFLTAMSNPPTRVSEHDRIRATDLAGRMAPAALTSAMETLGRTLIDMRQAPDPRIDIEVALVRLCQRNSEPKLQDLLKRIQQLEERLEADHSAGTSRHEKPQSPLRERGSPAGSPPPTVSQPAANPRQSAANQPPTANRQPTASPQQSTPPASKGHVAPPVPKFPPPSSSSSPSRFDEESPAQQARRALNKRPETAKARTPSPPQHQEPPSVTIGEPAAAPPPVLDLDLTSLRPQSAKEVVELAEQHLGLPRETVVTRAKEILPPKNPGEIRPPEELLTLWQDLITRTRSQQFRSQRPQTGLADKSEQPTDDQPTGHTQTERRPADIQEHPRGPEHEHPDEHVQRPTDTSGHSTGRGSATEPGRVSGPTSATVHAERDTLGTATSPEYPACPNYPGSAAQSGSESDAENEAADIADMADTYHMADVNSMSDLDKARSHADGIEARIMEAFPGATIETLTDEKTTNP